MLATGIVRKLDALGRIVLPKELRQTLDIYEKDSLVSSQVKCTNFRHKVYS